MTKNRIFAGYINLKPINGVIFPSYAQNQINKNYIVEKLNGEFFLSTNENTYGTNNIVLKSLLEEKRIRGICMLSTFHLPDNFEERNLIYKLAKKFEKEIHFVFEEIDLINLRKIDQVEEQKALGNSDGAFVGCTFITCPAQLKPFTGPVQGTLPGKLGDLSTSTGNGIKH